MRSIFQDILIETSYLNPKTRFSPHLPFHNIQPPVQDIQVYPDDREWGLKGVDVLMGIKTVPIAPFALISSVLHLKQLLSRDHRVIEREGV